MSTFPDLYAAVTERIIAALEAGAAPWHCPWRRDPADARPVNATTARPYRGINVLLLNLQSLAHGYQSSRWLTCQQARAVDAFVRKGEQGTQIVFFKMHEIDKVGHQAPATDPERRLVPLLRTFTVFNVDQIEGLPAKLMPEQPQPLHWEPLAQAETILTSSGAVLRHGGSRAFYAPDADFIQMPPRAAFDSAGDYYATALHELTHWTGHPTRCDRPLGRRHGVDAYAFEELVAEMGAAFLTDHCGLVGRVEHASYIAAWLQALRNDKRLIFTAASQAQKAADFLLPQLAAVEAAMPAAAAA